MSFFEHYARFGYQFQQDLNDVLLGEATEAVKDVMQEKLAENVYSYEASEQAMATRRYEEGGLYDRENMVSHVEPGLTLVVENIAKFQDAPLNSRGKDLSDVVQEGLSSYNQPYPRPFTADTESECISRGNVLQAINEGLRKKGYTIELEGGI